MQCDGCEHDVEQQMSSIRSADPELHKRFDLLFCSLNACVIDQNDRIEKLYVAVDNIAHAVEGVVDYTNRRYQTVRDIKRQLRFALRNMENEICRMRNEYNHLAEQLISNGVMNVQEVFAEIMSEQEDATQPEPLDTNAHRPDSPFQLPASIVDEQHSN